MTLPPLLFIHGAANGAWVWDFWRREMKTLGWNANVVDLRGHGLSLPVDFESVTMEDYVGDVESVTPQMVSRLGSHPVLIGWSMGGLVTLMYAAKHSETPALVLLEPSPTEQVQGRATAAELRQMPLGAIGPEAYGLFVDDPLRSAAALDGLTDSEAASVLEQSRGALESGLARRQRKAGIGVPAGSVRCPTIVIYGEHDSAAETNRRLALFLGGDSLSARETSHWGLVYSEKVVGELAPKLDEWLRRNLGE